MGNFIQPKGSTSTEIAREILSKTYSINYSEIDFIKQNLSVTGLKLLIDPNTQYIWGTISSSETGTISSWSIDSTGEIMTVLTTNGTLTLRKISVSTSTTTANSIYNFMTSDDIYNIKNVVGIEINVDYALQKAINSGLMSIYYPPSKGIYVHSNVCTLPSGFNMYGQSRKPYTVSNDASFNNCGTVIRLASGSPGIFVLSGRHTFDNIVFDGRNNTVGSMNATSQVSGCRFEKCGFYRWGIGLGRTSGYVATVYARGCNFSGNNTAMQDWIDSRAVDCTINAQVSRGIAMRTGANNNAWVGCRVEWNGTDGFYFYQSVGNVITGELIDRNGYAGITVADGASVSVTTCSIQRNGRISSNTNNGANILINDSGIILLNGNRFTAGIDDGGTGILTPDYDVICAGGTGKILIASGNSFSGGKLGYMKEVTIANKVITGNYGLPDIVNIGTYQKSSGLVKMGNTSTGTLPPAASSGTLTLSLSRPAMTQYMIPQKIVLEISARDTIGGRAEYFTVPLLCSWESTVPVINMISSKLDTYPDNVWGPSTNTPTGVQVSVSTTSDGSTITINLVSMDTRNRQIQAYIRGA